MMSDPGPRPYHPLLIAVFPLLALLAVNVGQVQFAETLRSFAVVIAGATASMALLALLLKDSRRAGLVTSLLAALFFSYGHAFRLLQVRSFPADVLLAIWATLAIFGSWVIIRILRPRRVHAATRFLNAASFLLVGVSAAQVLLFAIRTTGVIEERAFDPLRAARSPLKSAPDIYYIVLDGYGRQDVLADLYGYDNSNFIGYLEQRGFYVADGSRSNYGQTSLSLASSLNFDYVNDLAGELAGRPSTRDPLSQIIGDSRLRNFLEAEGYRTVALASGYSVTELSDADLYLNEGSTLNPFEAMWLSNSASALIVDILQPAWYRERLLTNLGTLSAIPASPDPQFVFAHVLMPHPPFVFGPEGEPRPPKSFREGNYYEGTTQEYMEGYRGQITFLNAQLERIVDDILENPESAPIIVLQADHGPGALLNWDRMEGNCFRERMSILNAYYVPEVYEVELYEEISPVNSFRAVLDGVFGTDLGLLPDRSYFSLWRTPYELHDVTDQADSCA